MKNNKEATLKEWGELLDKMGLNDASTTKINIARILESDASKLLKEEMSKEKYDQIIDEAYINFVNSVEKNREEDYTRPVISKEEFVSEIKFHRDFSEKWGLKIEERELSLEERFNLRYPGGNFSVFQENYPNTHKRNNPNDLLDVFNIPTKLITLTYNNETIEVYE